MSWQIREGEGEFRAYTGYGKMEYEEVLWKSKDTAHSQQTSILSLSLSLRRYGVWKHRIVGGVLDSR